ncbi:MAG: DEAD/DEAH box helicase [Prevotellaceae bacterium]|nr:DEAD/DEAH box helicase [Prevotellaceae bacterium]
MDFYDLYLSDNTLDAIDDMGWVSCTPIQEKCIPEILDGKDVLGIAQTGTGKTAAYLLPILSLLDEEDFPEDAINCVIMSPTRELAQQIDQAMQGFSYYMPDVNSVAVYGGNDGGRYDQESKSMKMGCDIVIATPGRLISHITMGNVDFSRVSFFVLDEADRMLDMGFSDDIMSIAKLLPDTCQTIMFSATMPDKIEELARTILKSPAIIKLAVSKPAEKIKQSAYVCHENQKTGILRSIFKENEPKRVIIFSSSKVKVKEINRTLRTMNINSGEMHSDLSQSERDDVMYRFKSGQIGVLVATDIVSRGIDIDDISMVINYDVPHDSEDYVHRIGRTARADHDGIAITLVRGKEIYNFMQIEKFLEREVEKVPLPEGLGEAPEYKAMQRKDFKKKKFSRKRKGGFKDKKKPNSMSAKSNKESKENKAAKAENGYKADKAARANKGEKKGKPIKQKAPKQEQK